MKKMVLAELTDGIAEKEGFESVDDLKRGIKTKLQAMYEQKEEIRIKEEIFDKLVKENAIFN